MRIEDGTPVLDGDGQPVMSLAPVKCERTPCGSYYGKPRIMPEWEPLLERYYLIRSFDFAVMPQAGGLRDQNWLEVRLLAAVRNAERQVEQEVATEQRAARR